MSSTRRPFTEEDKSPYDLFPAMSMTLQVVFIGDKGKHDLKRDALETAAPVKP
jgi:hypothetical protein